MKIIIIEDEQLSAERIVTLIHSIDKNIELLAVLDSIKSTVDWFEKNEKPDLVFMDIQLGDGISFDIFDQIQLEMPVIFITAYQEYAIRAFKVNSIDYLLKPVTSEALSAALNKYKKLLSTAEVFPAINSDVLLNIKQMIDNSYKSRFMVKVADRIRSVDIDDVLYFYSMEKGIYMHTAENRNYGIDYTLDGLLELLNPRIFFRINRQYIITHQSIENMISLSGSKLKIQLRQCDNSDILISRERLSTFKAWLDS